MKHAMIPDTQIFPDSETTHIDLAAKYLRRHKPDKIIIIGDWWDMPSLSSYDKHGDKGWETKERTSRPEVWVGSDEEIPERTTCLSL